MNFIKKLTDARRIIKDLLPNEEIDNLYNSPYEFDYDYLEDPSKPKFNLKKLKPEEYLED